MIIELILLAGLFVLHSSLRKVSARVDALQAEIDRLLERDRAAVPTALPSPAQLAGAAAETVPPWPDKTGKAAPAASTSPPQPPPSEGENRPRADPFALLFERFVGGRLLIWVGGIALAVAGIFLVRYSIEIGLVTPAMRMIAAALFGLLLVAGGEAARRRADGDADPRIGQALAGAGILVLYVASYGALVLYGLIGIGAATLLMGLTTLAALLLSLRHGEPTAVMGLIGGFLTPLLVGDPDSDAVTLLAYLGLLNIALYALAQRQGWTWLAASAALLSFLWTGGLLLASPADALAAGLFIVVLSIAASLVKPGQGRLLARMRPAAIGLLQLGVLVARTDIGLGGWLLFGMLAAAGLWLSNRAEAYRLFPLAALLLALLLLAGDASAGRDFSPLVAAVATSLFAGHALAGIARGETSIANAATAAIAIAAPASLLRICQEGLLPSWGWAMLLIGLGAACAMLVWRLRGHALGGNPPDPRLSVASAAAAFPFLLAAYDMVPAHIVPALWMVVAVFAAGCARRLNDSAVSAVACGVAVLAALRAIPLLAPLWTTIAASIVGQPALADMLPGGMRGLWLLAVPGLLLLTMHRLLPPFHGRIARILAAAGGIALALAAYIVFKRLFGLSGSADFVVRGFAERMLITQSLFLAGWLFAHAGRTGISAWLTGLAAARLVWFDLVVHNPALDSQAVGSLPVVNLLLPAFIGGSAWLYAARRRTAGGGSGLWLGLALLALIAGAALMVRQAFHGAFLNQPEMSLGELYGYSLVGLLLAAALIIGGIRLRDKALRAAGLALLAATIVKVFLADADALEGILRIVSFLGLGIALIVLGTIYGTVLNREGRPAD